jgi:hypothetical protein
LQAAEQNFASLRDGMKNCEQLPHCNSARVRGRLRRRLAL